MNQVTAAPSVGKRRPAHLNRVQPNRSSAVHRVITITCSMTRLILIRFGAALLLGLGLLSGAAEPVQAQTNHECARQAVRSGLILPLGTILARVRRRVRGRLVGVTLRGCRGGPWIYQIRMLTDQGRVAVIKANARTGQILGVRGAGRIYNRRPQYRGSQQYRNVKPWYRRRRR